MKISSRFLILALFLGVTNLLFAQEEARKTSDLSGITKNVVIGYAYSDFVYAPNATIKSNFSRIGYSPTMIWKLGDKLFFESQVEFFTDSGTVKTQVEYSKLSYIYNKYITIGMGKILTPFGMYTERFEAPFIERMPNAPLGFKHIEGFPSVGPTGSELGVDIRGGFQAGDAKMNYVVYVANGARINNGEEEKKLAGSVDYENYFDNNNNKSIGGRIGYLPFSNSSLELGASYNTSKVGDVNSEFKDVVANAYGADFSYHRAIQPIKTLINVKGQMNYLSVGEAEFLNEAGEKYHFENNSYIYYVRLSARPALVRNRYIKRIELLGRYNFSHMAEKALWGGTTTRLDLGFSYWLSLRTGLRVAYEKTQLPSEKTFETVLIRFVTGF
jgi:hypothetical protein